jgi:hypothetical protein
MEVTMSRTEEPMRCKAGDRVMFIATSAAGRTGVIRCRPIDDIDAGFTRTIDEIQLAMQMHWVVELDGSPQQVHAYGRIFRTALFLAMDAWLVPLFSETASVEWEEEVSV